MTGRASNTNPAPIAEERLAQAKALWEAGISTLSIAFLIGRSENTTREIAKRYGWSRPQDYAAKLRQSARWNPTQQQVARLTKLWTDGTRDWEMQDEFRVSYHAISAAAARLGLPARNIVDLNEKRRQGGIGKLGHAAKRMKTIARLFDEGVDRDSIIDRFGVTRTTLHGIVGDARRAGIIKTFSRYSWKPTDRDLDAIRIGVRLGVFCSTIGFLISPTRPIPASAIQVTAERLQLIPRNRVRLLRYLSPEQFWAGERSGITPYQRVARLYACTRKLSEDQAVQSLEDYIEALSIFPMLATVMVPLRVIPYAREFREVTDNIRQASERLFVARQGDVVSSISDLRFKINHTMDTRLSA